MKNFEFSNELKNQVKELCSDYPDLLSLVESNDMNALTYLQGSYLMTIPFSLFKSCKENGDFSRINDLISKSERKSALEIQMHKEINMWQLYSNKL
jgi:hypothetical protein